jgi:hypothetical protein
MARNNHLRYLTEYTFETVSLFVYIINVVDANLIGCYYLIQLINKVVRDLRSYLNSTLRFEVAGYF